MITKVLVFLSVFCAINMSIAFRTRREASTELDPKTYHLVILNNFLHIELYKTVPQHRIEAIYKIIVDMLTSKTPAEDGATSMEFMKLLIESALFEQGIFFTSDQCNELGKLLANISNYSNGESDELSEKDINLLRGELSKVLPTNVTELVTNTFSALIKRNSSNSYGENLEATLSWLNIIVDGTRKRYGNNIAPTDNRIG